MDGARSPNLNLLADLIRRAKGATRTLREFSGEVGVSPATMSRIMNGKINRPLNNELLSAIAANADPESQVTIYMLQRANAGAVDDPRLVDAHSNFLEVERRAIIDGLIRRGYTVKGCSSGGKAFSGSNSGYRMRFDLEIETNALDQDKDNFDKWAFEFKHLRFAHDGIMYRQWIANIMSVFYCKSSNVKRISLVIDEEMAFEKIKKELGEICIPDEISVILVADGEVKEEYIIPTLGPTPKEVFYKLPEQSVEAKPIEDDWDSDFNIPRSRGSSSKELNTHRKREALM